MLKHESKAFIFNDVIEGKEVIGNPATIFILEHNEEFSRENMSKLSIEEQSPMCCFLKKLEDNSFKIFYYNLDGSQAYMCGHGTIAAANVLNEFHIDVENENNNFGRIEFHFDTEPFKERIEDDKIISFKDGEGKIFIEQKIHNYDNIYIRNEQIKYIIDSLGLSNSNIINIFKALELNDLVFVVDDNRLLRKIKPDFKKMSLILEKLGIRNMCITAWSDLPTFDFETRVFVPHDNLDEDIACGSSNLTISKYWSHEMNKDSFKILFPYHMEYDDALIGGVQFTRIENDMIKIGGYSSIIN